jgi:hypothetical protein
MNLETNEADAADQSRPVREEDLLPEDPPPVDVEADPADLTDQYRPAPVEDEEWPDE